MRLTHSRRLTGIATLAILLLVIAPGPVIAAQATTEQIRVVNVTQRGGPPTGPHPIVIEHDQRFATHTIYRPATLGPSKHPVLVWGNGACVKNGLSFPEYLSEIASYGFVVVADGPPVTPAPRGGGGQAGAAAPAAPPRG